MNEADPASPAGGRATRYLEPGNGARRETDLLTTREVASELKVSMDTVQDWLSAGRLRGFKLGGGSLWRVRRADLEAFVSAPPAPRPPRPRPVTGRFTRQVRGLA